MSMRTCLYMPMRVCVCALYVCVCVCVCAWMFFCDRDLSLACSCVLAVRASAMNFLVYINNIQLALSSEIVYIIISSSWSSSCLLTNEQTSNILHLNRRLLFLTFSLSLILSLALLLFLVCISRSHTHICFRTQRAKQNSCKSIIGGLESEHTLLPRPTQQRSYASARRTRTARHIYASRHSSLLPNHSISSIQMKTTCYIAIYLPSLTLSHVSYNAISDNIITITTIIINHCNCNGNAQRRRERWVESHFTSTTNTTKTSVGFDCKFMDTTTTTWENKQNERKSCFFLLFSLLFVFHVYKLRLHVPH